MDQGIFWLSAEQFTRLETYLPTDTPHRYPLCQARAEFPRRRVHRGHDLLLAIKPEAGNRGYFAPADDDQHAHSPCSHERCSVDLAHYWPDDPGWRDICIGSGHTRG